MGLLNGYYINRNRKIIQPQPQGHAVAVEPHAVAVFRFNRTRLRFCGSTAKIEMRLRARGWEFVRLRARGWVFLRLRARGLKILRLRFAVQAQRGCGSFSTAKPHAVADAVQPQNRMTSLRPAP